MEVGMQHKVLAGVALASMMAGSAFAADMPLKAVAPVAMYDWSGTYLGGVIGGAWGTNDVSETGLGIVGTLLGVPAVQTVNTSGFIGGVEGGSRYQFGKLVVGWEGDITFGKINGTSTTSFVGPLGALGIPPISRSLAVNTNWTATTTSTLGIAHNNWLLYGKAGVAWENVSYTDNWAIAGIPLFSGTTVNFWQAGWTVGTGIEWAFYNNWSLKAEYDYLDFGTKNVQVNGTLLGAVAFAPGIQDNNHINQFKAGLNYRIMPNFW
jgi:outer membrane immunogenic protein